MAFVFRMAMRQRGITSAHSAAGGQTRQPCHADPCLDRHVASTMFARSFLLAAFAVAGAAATPTASPWANMPVGIKSDDEAAKDGVEPKQPRG